MELLLSLGNLLFRKMRAHPAFPNDHHEQNLQRCAGKQQVEALEYSHLTDLGPDMPAGFKVPTQMAPPCYSWRCLRIAYSGA